MSARAPKPGVRRDPKGRKQRPVRIFVTTGTYRVWKNGEPGDWQRMPAENPLAPSYGGLS